MHRGKNLEGFKTNKKVRLEMGLRWDFKKQEIEEQWLGGAQRMKSLCPTTSLAGDGCEVSHKAENNAGQCRMVL